MEKEVVQLLVSFFGLLVCIINSVLIYGNIINKKPQFKLERIFIIILLTIMSVIFLKINIVVLKMSFSIFCTVILAYIFYKNSIKKTIFYSFLDWGFGMIFDMLFMMAFSYILSNFSLRLFIPIEYLCTFLLQLIYYLISRTTLFKITVKSLYTIFNKINLYLIFFLIISLVYMGATAVLNMHDFSNIIVIFIMGFFAIWLIIGTLIIIYLKKSNKEINKLLLKNNNFYVNVNTDFRKFKHNLLYKLNGVKSYSEKKAKPLLEEIVAECQSLKYSNKELDKIPNGINGLIQELLYNEENIDILVDNQVNNDLLDLISSKNYIRLSEIIGVTIDNAIESMKKSLEKILYISFEQTDSSLIVILKNTFSSFIDIDKLGTINYSSKGKGHGIGLFSILFNNNIKTKLRIVNNMFETKIIIPKIKDKED